MTSSARRSAGAVLPRARDFHNHEYSSDVRQFAPVAHVSEHTLGTVPVTGTDPSALNRIQAAEGGVQ